MIEFVYPCPVTGEHELVCDALEILDLHRLGSKHLRPSALSETFRCIDGIDSESSFGNGGCIEPAANPCGLHDLKAVWSIDGRQDLSVMAGQYAQSRLSVHSVLGDCDV